jgi:hypothetical protein
MATSESFANVILLNPGSYTVDTSFNEYSVTVSDSADSFGNGSTAVGDFISTSIFWGDVDFP